MLSSTMLFYFLLTARFSVSWQLLFTIPVLATTIKSISASVCCSWCKYTPLVHISHLNFESASPAKTANQEILRGGILVCTCEVAFVVGEACKSSLRTVSFNSKASVFF